MRPLYGLMGLVALASAKMSRFRINGIPSNWLVIGVCAFVAMVAWESRQDAIENPKAPQKMSADQFLSLASTQFKHRYVSVSGTILPLAVLTVEKRSSKYDLVPMFSSDKRSAFFVKASVGAYSGQPREATITGMMWGTDSSLRNDLASKASQMGGGKIAWNTNVQLHEGQTPGNPANSTALMTASGTVSGLFLLSSLLKHIIFQKGRGASASGGSSGALPGTSPSTSGASGPFTQSTVAASTASSTSGVSLDKAAGPADPASASEAASSSSGGAQARVSGKLRLHEKCAERFLEVPAVLTRLENNELAVVSSIDASSRMDGAVTQQRVGVWLLVPRAGSLRWEEGWQYSGLKRSPALRLKFEDALDKNKASSAVLAFDDESQRAQAVHELSRV